jgi:hypothetical protein
MNSFQPRRRVFEPADLTYISLLERGRRMPSIKIVQVLAAALDTRSERPGCFVPQSRAYRRSATG